ncbi:hypothetical protein E4U60_006010, partial [Claviceps pazoutovae]
SRRNLDLNSFQYIARSARAIIEECGDTKFEGRVLGQALMPYDWNVIIRQDVVEVWLFGLKSGPRSYGPAELRT